MPHSLIHPLTHCFPDVFNQANGKLATAIALVIWQKCLEYRGEKTFHNIKCLYVAIFW